MTVSKKPVLDLKQAYPVSSKFATNVVSHAIYLDFFVKKHPHLPVHQIIYDNEFFNALFDVFKTMCGEKLNKQKFAFLVLAFISCTASGSTTSASSMKDLYKMWPGLTSSSAGKSAASSRYARTKSNLVRSRKNSTSRNSSFEGAFPSFAQRVANSLFNDFQASSKKLNSNNTTNNTTKTGGSMPYNALGMVISYLIAHLVPEGRARTNVYLVVGWLFFLWGMLNIYNGFDDLINGQLLRQSAREVMPELRSSFSVMGSTALAISGRSQSTEFEPFARRLDDFESEFENVMNQNDDAMRDTQHLNLMGLIFNNNLNAYARQEEALRQFFINFGRTPFYNNLVGEVERFGRNMQDSLEAVTVHTARVEGQGIWGSFRNLVGMVGDAMYNMGHADDALRTLRANGAQELVVLMQRVSNEFARVIQLSCTRLNVRIQRDVWGIREGITQVVISGAYLIQVYRMLFRARRQRLTQIENGNGNGNGNNRSRSYRNRSPSPPAALPRLK